MLGSHSSMESLVQGEKLHHAKVQQPVFKRAILSNQEKEITKTVIIALKLTKHLQFCCIGMKFHAAYPAFDNKEIKTRL